jgi:flagellar protein FliO/FliZ
MNMRSWIAAPCLVITMRIGAAEGEASARLAESPLSAANLANTALGLLLVLAVMLALAWLVRRFMQVPGVGKGAVRILGGVSLGARERAVLLSVDKRRILVGVAPGQVRTLADLGIDETLDEASDAAADAPPFAQQLGRLLNRRVAADAAGKSS